MTEASENVWGTALPYLVAVDSSTDLNADNYLYTVQFTTEQMQQALGGLGLLPDLAAPASWFGEAALTFGLCSLPACLRAERHWPGPAQSSGPAERLLHGAVSGGQLSPHHQGLWPRCGAEPVGCQALAEQGQSAEEILAHYFPGTELRR